MHQEPRLGSLSFTSLKNNGVDSEHCQSHWLSNFNLLERGIRTFPEPPNFKIGMACLFNFKHVDSSMINTGKSVLTLEAVTK